MAVLQCQLFVLEGDADDRAERQRRDQAARGGQNFRIEGPLDDEIVGVGLEGQDLLAAIRNDRDAVSAEADLLDAMKNPHLKGGGHCVSHRHRS